MSLSSAEAETRAVVKAMIEGLYVSNILGEIGVRHELKIYTDSSSCIGHCNRSGNGKNMRHLDAAELWIQQIFRAGRAHLRKINGKENPADMYTKYISRAEITYHMATLGFRLLDNRSPWLPVGDKDLSMEWPEGHEIRNYVEEEPGETDEHMQVASLFGGWLHADT